MLNLTAAALASEVDGLPLRGVVPDHNDIIRIRNKDYRLNIDSISKLEKNVSPSDIKLDLRTIFGVPPLGIEFPYLDVYICFPDGFTGLLVAKLFPDVGYTSCD